jgi:phosphoserine phosphatase
MSNNAIARNIELEPRPLAAFDLDGTLFKTSMLEAVYEQACLRRYVSVDDQRQLEELRVLWAHDNNTEESYAASVSALVKVLIESMTGRTPRDLDELVLFAMEKRLRTRRFVRESMQILAPTRNIVIVSASLADISRSVLKQTRRVDSRITHIPDELIFGSEWGITNGYFDGKGNTINKKQTMEELLADDRFLYDGSSAFGDTISDYEMLAMVQKGFMVNPSVTLELKGWESLHRVVEWKDNMEHTPPSRDLTKSYITLGQRLQTTRGILKRTGLIET